MKALFPDADHLDKYISACCQSLVEWHLVVTMPDSEFGADTMFRAHCHKCHKHCNITLEDGSDPTDTVR